MPYQNSLCTYLLCWIPEQPAQHALYVWLHGAFMHLHQGFSAVKYCGCCLRGFFVFFPKTVFDTLIARPSMNGDEGLLLLRELHQLGCLRSRSGVAIEHVVRMYYSQYSMGTVTNETPCACTQPFKMTNSGQKSCILLPQPMQRIVMSHTATFLIKLHSRETHGHSFSTGHQDTIQLRQAI